MLGKTLEWKTVFVEISLSSSKIFPFASMSSFRIQAITWVNSALGRVVKTDNLGFSSWMIEGTGS